MIAPSTLNGISPHANGGMLLDAVWAGEGRPCSNTGRKPDRREGFRKTLPNLSEDGSFASGALVDWLGATIPPCEEMQQAMDDDAHAHLRLLLSAIFRGSAIALGDIQERGRNGYTHSAELISGAAPVGFITFGGNRGTINFQLSGDGCRAVADWYHVSKALTALEARITRVDLAFDDYKAEHIDFERWAAQAEQGEVRAGNGPRPGHRIIRGSAGRTLYVGKKGAKELCVYDKGREQGDPDSPWLRAEVRVWGKDRDIPHAVLTRPLAFIRAAYNVLCELPGDVCERIKTTARTVEANIKAAVRWAYSAFGPTVNLLFDALGATRAVEVINESVRRNSVPRRFAGFTRDQLHHHIGETLCPF